jgi:hypothetical protein
MGNGGGTTGGTVAPWSAVVAYRTWVLSTLRCSVSWGFFAKTKSRWSTFLPRSSLKSGKLLGGARWQPLSSKHCQWWSPFFGASHQPKLGSIASSRTPHTPRGFNCFGQQRICHVQRSQGFWACRSKFGSMRHLFTGLLPIDHRGWRL